MSEPVKMEKEANTIEKEDARAGYQVAVDLWIYQGKLNWDRFNVMLVACSIITALIGAIASINQQLPFVISVLAILGLILSHYWFGLTARGFDHHTFWGLCAWDLENRYLKDTVTTVTKLQDLKDKGEVNFEEIGQGLAFDTRGAKSQREAAYAVIWVFRGAFILAIAFDIVYKVIL